MSDDDDLEPAAGETDPWAPGGAMSTAPIPPPPRFFEPAAPVASGPTPDATAAPDDRSPMAGEPPVGGPEASTEPPFPWVVLALGAVAALIAVGTWLIVRDDRTEPPAAAAPSTMPLFDPPAITSSAPPTTEPAPSAGAGAGVGVEERLDAVIALPAALESLAPTELVVLTNGGEVVQLDTATGVLETVLSAVPFGSPKLSATDNAILVHADGAQPFVVARRTAKPVLLESSTTISGVIAEYDDEFLLQPAFPQDQPLEVRLDPVVRTAEYDFAVGDAWSASAHPSGDLMVPGEGGTYLLSAGGPTPISTGVVVAVGRNHVLFRVCPGAGACVLVLDDVANGVQTELTGVVDADIEPGRSPYWLSPDGAALVRIAFDESGPTIRIVELQTGAIVDVPTDPTSLPPSLLWAPDSSGFFAVVDGAVEFRDRASGEVIELTALADVLGGVGGARSLAVRPAPPPEGADKPVAISLSGPTGLRLLALSSDDDVVELDIDGRAFATRPGLPIQSGAPAFLYPDATGVTVVSWDNVPGFRLDDGGEPQVIAPDSSLGHAFPGPAPGMRWQSRPNQSPDVVAFDLVDSNGASLGQSIEVDNAYPLGADGGGGLLVIATGGIYVATPEGAVRITSGELIASGPSVMFARECDEFLTCGVVRIDRATGERVPIEHPTLVGAAGFQTAELAGRTVSPDGNVVLAQTSPNGLSWSFVDLATDTDVGVPGPANATTVVWSDDSQYAVYLSGNRLRVYDRAAATLVTLTDLPPIRAFAEDV